ncbi:hypothetical protein EI77_03272 [Prosthecobacter fusiformis]|uniref:Uncharacterized protein n=1 Tax=Prosthecobacter fusiformis TaxID=48464 RepID=A0A4R7RTP9_9BACT|nr:hypothetical protein [Prosthecobacter fusiformis]TDU68155.1 hypothetical protein EI77_03272 [Prosthecobacter fusiformis]
MTSSFFALAFSTVLLLLAPVLDASETFKPVACEGAYPKHLQGFCANGKDAYYWSWTDAIVKTGLDGRILKKVSAPSHQGDLCFHDGKVYVAVNLGKFNEPAGQADSWVFVFDADTLKELSRHPVPELVHGAGGMACKDGRFIIVGGLPPDTGENYIYEYDSQLRFIQKHILASGQTEKGIQTAEYADGSWWFGCYGKPAILLRADENFKFTGKWAFNASVGIARIAPNQFLVAENQAIKGVGNTARLRIAHAHPEQGLIIDPNQP